MVALFSRPGPGLAGRFFAVATTIAVAAPALAQGPIEINATAITQFDKNDRELRRFGKLEFRGGLELTSPAKEFGGISALRMDPDGARFLAVTDTGRWLRGRITYSGSAPAGIADPEMAQMLGADGKKLPRGWFDTEAVAQDGGTVYVGLERVHRVLKYDFGKSGFQARGVPIPVPVDFKGLPNNRGIESLAVMPTGSPIAGALVAISEAAFDGNGDIKAYLIGGPRPGVFAIKRTEDFDITDCALLPGGDLLLLERRFSILRSGVRIRRVAGGDIFPGTLVNANVVFQADFSQQIDNFEAIGVHRTAAGETVLTLVSDDNFSPLQRTLLMQFKLIE